MSILINSSNAQSLDNSSNAQSLDNFLNYTNNDMKFSIQHPSNWQVEEDEKSPHETVWFKLPDRRLPIFVVQTSKDKPYLDTDTMTLKNTSIQQHVQRMQNLLSSLNIGYNLIRQNEVTVGGNTGIKTEYSTGSHYHFETVTTANGNFYTLTYQDDPLKVPETLPLANKMVESFQLIK